MIKIVSILLVLLAGVVPVPTAYTEPNIGQILDELNLARTDPAHYATFLKERRGHYKGKQYNLGGGSALMTNEGVSALDEAIAFLEKAKPVGPLTFSDSLSVVAMELVRANGPIGRVGHESAGGMVLKKRAEMRGRWETSLGENLCFGPTEPREIVVWLIIDDGVKSRGHRRNIFDPSFKVAGIACGPHRDYGTMCVIDFAGGYKPR
jgi:uncharacterized protein YkwD